MKYFKKLFVVLFLLVCFSCEKNKINVLTKGSLSKDDLKINLKLLKNDKLISEYTIMDKGVYKNIPNAYGENDWSIYYKDSLIFEFRHFKTNRKNSHNYVFELEKIKNDIICNVSILGTDELLTSNKN